MPTEPEALDGVVESVVQDAFTRALTNFKGTIYYGKKVSDGNYGGDDWGVHVQFDYAPDADAEDFLASAREAANLAAMTVYERLGLEFYRDDSGVVRQVLSAFPGAVVVAPASTGTSSSDLASTPPFTENEIKALPNGSDEQKDAKRVVREWAAARLAAFPAEFWDNRATKTGQQPDYKHKESGVGVWVS